MRTAPVLSAPATGGRETGQRDSRYIVEGGPFRKAYALLLAGGFHLEWQSVPFRTGFGGGGLVDFSKFKHTCQACGQNAWAKAKAVLLCGNCAVGQRMECVGALAFWGSSAVMLAQV